jgi:hypothetical protein
LTKFVAWRVYAECPKRPDASHACRFGRTHRSGFLCFQLRCIDDFTDGWAGQRRTPEVNRNEFSISGMAADPIISARDRAFQLARAGEHSSWAEIAAALMREAYGEYVVQGIGADQRARAELDSIILRAQATRRL